MHTYLHKVHEKPFKYLLSTFSDNPQSSILNSYLHVFRKSHEGITQIRISIFRAEHVTNGYQALQHTTHVVLRVRLTFTSLRHTLLVVYMRPTLIGRYDTHISSDVTVVKLRCTGCEFLVSF
jgi:hypothetical protein